MRKISYGKIILIIMYAIVSMFALMLINSILTAANDDMYYNEFYTQNMRKFNINYGKGADFPYNDLGDDYALYFCIVEASDRDNDSVRAAYLKGNVPVPDMLEGRFFTEEEMENGEKVAVLGALCKRNVEEKDGKEYYTFGNVRYEVIGYMGREDEVTDLDNMVWLNMGAYLDKASAVGRFAVDTGSETETAEVADRLLETLPEENRSQAAEIIHERKIRSISYFTRKIYNFIIIAIIINIAIVSVYYIDKRMYVIAVKKLVGASFMSIAGDIAAEYASFAAVGVVIGIISAFLLRFTPFASSDEVYMMSFSVPSVLVMFAATILLSLVISVIPIVRVYRYDLSQNIK